MWYSEKSTELTPDRQLSGLFTYLNGHCISSAVACFLELKCAMMMTMIMMMKKKTHVIQRRLVTRGPQDARHPSCASAPVNKEKHDDYYTLRRRVMIKSKGERRVESTSPLPIRRQLLRLIILYKAHGTSPFRPSSPPERCQ